MTNEDVSSPEVATPAEPSNPKESAYLRANMTVKARRSPPSVIPFGLLIASILMAFGTSVGFAKDGLPKSPYQVLVSVIVPLAVIGVTIYFIRRWVYNTHTFQIQENAITAIAVGRRKTVEFGPTFRCGLYKAGSGLWVLYFAGQEPKGYGGALSANTAADRGTLVQLVNALHARGVTVMAFPKLNSEFIIQYNTVVPEWQPPLRQALGEEKHRFKLFGRRPARAASAGFVLGSNGIGLVSEQGVLEAYAFAEIGSFTVDFSTQKNVTVAKIHVVFLNRFVWKEEVEVADEEGKKLLLEASAAVKAMNSAPPQDSAQADAPKQDAPVEDALGESGSGEKEQ